MPKSALIASIVALSLGQVPTVPISQQSTVAWDHTGLDINGQPDTLSSFEIAITTVGGSPNSPDRSVITTATPTTTGGNIYQSSLNNLLQGLPEGDYNLWVRAIDMASNPSAWTTALPVTVDLTAPAAPSNIRIEINITFTN